MGISPTFLSEIPFKQKEGSALSSGTGWSCRRSVHQPQCGCSRGSRGTHWHSSEQLATVSFSLAIVAPKPSHTFSAHHQLWWSLLWQGAVAGSCPLLATAWSEKKAPSCGTPFSFLCIPGLHPPDSLLQATLWWNRGGPTTELSRSSSELLTMCLSLQADGVPSKMSLLTCSLPQETV